jgi:hypothetical protein
MHARGLRHVWGLLVGIYLAYVLYPFIYEWQQRRLNKRRLRMMREKFARGRRWDATKGGWLIVRTAQATDPTR